MDDDGSETPIRTSLNVDDDDDDDRHLDSETQFFDSQSWSPKCHGGDVDIGDGNESSQSTVPMNDTVVFEEAFETQVVDLAAETQVMDFDWETQVVDFGGDTQLLDEVNCIENLETQVLDCFKNEEVRDIDGEVSDSTAVLSDGGDLRKKGGDLSGETEEVQCSSASKESKRGSIEPPETPNNEQDNYGFHVAPTVPVQDSVSPKHGSKQKQFTTVRTASLRASGLAARNTALRSNKNVFSSIPASDKLSRKFGFTNNAASAMNLGNEGDRERDLVRNNIIVNDARNKTMCKDSNLAARKLCYDNGKEELSHNTNKVDNGKDLTKFPAGDLAGLSYVGSQEPGDLSQANALDFVDKFLKESMAEFDQENGHGKSTGGKSVCVSTVKGAQKLAKNVNVKSMTEGLGIYDWDDSQEDEGGGDILRKINRDLSSGGSLGRKASNGGVNNLQDGTGRRMGIFRSDSKLLSRNIKVANMPVQESKRIYGRNLIDELNTESDIGHQEKLLENDPNKIYEPDKLDVRFDTQMAAEAMETLFFGEGIANHDVDDASQCVKKESSSHKGRKQPESSKRMCPDDEDFASRKSKKFRMVDTILDNTSHILSKKQSRKAGKKSKVDHVTIEPQKEKDNGGKNLEKMSGESTRIGKGRPLKRGMKGLDGCDSTTSRGGFSLDKKHKEERVSSLGPVAHRTRRSVEPIARRTRRSATSSDGELHSLTGNLAVIGQRDSGRGSRESKMLILGDAQLRKTETIKSNLNKKFEKVAALDNSKEIDTLSFPKRRRSTRNLSHHVDKSDDIDNPPESSEVAQTRIRRKSSCRETRSSVKQGPYDQSSLRRSDGVISGNSESLQRRAGLDDSPSEKSKIVSSLCTTPVNCKIPTSNISPVCMGDEYLTQSRERSQAKKSVLREIRKLSITEPPSISPSKDLRKRRDITDVRVLYSHHLDEDITKHQKKILARLGVSVASSMADATHFIADHFVRTRNMLEAIASGKPVVTHLWLESCGQANCFIDEKQYILRDAKKEKEFGFSMPNTLACASQYPLLQGLRVLITPNTKPGTGIISNLVKAVGGQAVERVGRSALKDGAFPDDLLVLSCEEDYAICVPFIEQGATIYSSELLLNEIVSQKLEFDRYRLFGDHVRKTRSTIWLKKDGCKFLPVAKINKD